MRETTKLINLENIGKKLEEVASKSLDECSVKMEKDILDIPVGPVLVKGFTEKFASELIDGVLAKQGFGKQQPQYQKDSSTRVNTAEVIDKFLNAKQVRVKPVSLKSYGDTLRAFARYYPTLPTEPEPIEQYLARYSAENTSARNVYIVLRLFYKFVSERLNLPNPILKVEKPRGRAKPPEHLSVKQARALLDAIESDRERGLVYVLLGLGLRLSEALRLRFCDIGERTILITGKERVEPMPLISEIREALLKLADGCCPDDHVFRGRQGALSEPTIQLIIKKLFARAGISGVRSSPHTLRHSRGVIQSIAGLDSYSSRRLLRHASTEMTDKYTELNLNELMVKEEQYNPLRFLSEPELGKKPDYAQG